MLLTYKYRLNCEARQHRALERILEQQRQLYNAALEERIECYRKTGKSLNDIDQSKSLTLIRADDPAFALVQRRIQRATLKRLDRAYKSFFRRAKAGAGAASGFPKFRAASTSTAFLSTPSSRSSSKMGPQIRRYARQAPRPFRPAAAGFDKPGNRRSRNADQERLVQAA